MGSKRSFPSKILLFGEYCIIQDAMGLAMPYPLFEGRLTFPSEGQNLYCTKNSNQELRVFLQYLKECPLGAPQTTDFRFDWDAFEFDIEEGLYFDSTIPQGHGVGSSGALCAAVFDRYFIGSLEVPPNQEKVLALKKIFSHMESHFHEASSGLDPLVSFLERPLLIQFKNELGPVECPSLQQGRGAIFLFNSGRSRKTAPLVNLYLEMCKQTYFKENLLPKLLEVNNLCIDSFLKGDVDSLFYGIKDLSRFQLEHMTPLIPQLLRKTWAQGLASDEFYLKLCGAGGGGFFLGMTRDFEALKNKLPHYHLRPLFRL